LFSRRIWLNHLNSIWKQLYQHWVMSSVWRSPTEQSSRKLGGIYLSEWLKLSCFGNVLTGYASVLHTKQAVLLEARWD
jgi:hypothetical protein